MPIMYLVRTDVLQAFVVEKIAHLVRPHELRFRSQSLGGCGALLQLQARSFHTAGVCVGRPIIRQKLRQISAAHFALLTQAKVFILMFP